MKKKKIYKSNALNTVYMLERAIWLLPLFFFVYSIMKEAELVFEVIQAKPNLYVILIYMCIYGMDVLITFFPSFILFFVLKLILHRIKKRLLQNSSFITVEDFDYYRDKLTGLSPGIISILADLNVERKKDISASILKYQEMGILKYENNHYVITGDYKNAPLRASDRYLIEGLEKQSFHVKTDRKWSKLVEKEAMEEGYITNRFDPLQKKENRRKFTLGCLKGCLTPMVLFILAGILLFSLDYDYMKNILDMAPENGSVEQDVEYLNQYPRFCMTVLMSTLAMMVFVVSLISPALVVIGKIAGVFYIKLYKRTDYGNQMAEYVFGMKNFIHDFSNLSEASQEYIVLWDDYLVYAVVLEENQQIINEIANRRNRI